MSTTAILSEYAPEAEVAKQLGKSPRTLARWRMLRIGPPPTQIGRETVYRIDAVLEWLKSRETKIVRARGRRAS
jgi:hypothetical protein